MKRITMMNSYVACDNPGHLKFAHKIEECFECTITPSSAYRSIAVIDYSTVTRNDLISLLTEAERNLIVLMAENQKLKGQISYLSQGLHIKGWWCNCGIFNGEEKDTLFNCRSCGVIKPKNT